MTNYDRNRKRINQLIEMDMKQSSSAYIKDGYCVDHSDVAYLKDDVWDIMIAELQVKIGKKSESELFESYLEHLNNIKPPQMSDTRLSEMLATIQDLISEFTIYAKNELRPVEKPKYIQFCGRVKRPNLREDK